MKQKNKKGIFIVSLVGLVSCFSINAFGATKLYEHKETNEVVYGVTYENSIRATDLGIQDVHVITVDLTNEYISLAPSISSKNYGMRDNTLNILRDNNAVAGVNGDFFNMSGSYTAAFGLEMVDGEILSASVSTNQSNYNLSGLYIDNENNALINYFRTYIDFLNDGKRNIGIAQINKLETLEYPTVVNGLAMDNTENLDARFPNNLKIVVDNNIITNVLENGETIAMPENGYIVVVGAKSKDYYKQFYEVGQSAELVVKGGIDFDNVKTAIGGGGRILADGNPVQSGLVIGGRNPRTAVGISQDQSKIIILAVDGRGDSIGATHAEMGQLLKEYGAYNAMHLDGGGSTTVVASTYDDPNLKVVSSPSDGGMRSIINTLGVYNNAPTDMPVTELRLNADDGFANIPLTVGVYGLNEAHGRVEIGNESLRFASDDENSYWVGNTFYPSRVGDTTIRVSLVNELGEEVVIANKLISIGQLAELRPSKDSISVRTGESSTLSFIGVSAMGDEIEIAGGVTYEVVPATAGTVTNNVFVSNGENGYIKASLGAVDTYIGVYSTTRLVSIDNFTAKRGISFVSYNGSDSAISGQAYYVNNETMNGIALTYDFPHITGTQAAYLKFDEPIVLTGNPDRISLDVYGDNSQNWLRGQVLDADGKVFTVDFARNINWSGLKKVTATIPSEVKYPITLSRVYVANTVVTAENKSGTIHISNLTGDVPYNDSNLIVPVGAKYKDQLNMNITTSPTNGEYDITIIGDWIVKNEKNQGDNYEKIKNQELEKIKSNATKIIYAGETDVTTNVGVPVYKWSSNYSYGEHYNFGMIQLASGNTGLTEKDPYQWGKLASDIILSNKTDMLILMDKNPLKFTNNKEVELFQSIMVKAAENGKNVFVISTDGVSTETAILNGVRYCNLGSLFNSNGQKNSDFATVRFRMTQDGVVYQIRR